MKFYSAVNPQPEPAYGSGDVWREIIDTLPAGNLRAICEARRQMGIDKYGQPLMRHDGRNHAVDEAQEYLDAAVYRASRFGSRDARVTLLLAWALDCLEGNT